MVVNTVSDACLAMGEGANDKKYSEFQVGNETEIIFRSSFAGCEATITQIIHPWVHSMPFHLSRN